MDVERVQMTIRIFLLIDAISQIFGLYMLVFTPKNHDFQIVMFGFLITLLLFVMSIAPTNVHSLAGLDVSRTFLSFRFLAGFQAVVVFFRLKFSAAAIAWLVFHWFYLSFTIGVLLATTKKYKRAVEPKTATTVKIESV
jgi:hypothetical protein